MTDALLLPDRHRRILTMLLREHLPGVEAWAYGSRVNGRGHEGSDLDLVLRGPGLDAIPLERLIDFADAVRESTIPILVEARDWSRLPERFRREIEREYVVVTGGARLDTFGTALAQLTDACDRERYGYLELAGLIKTFEFTFELAWKVLKDLLFYEGHDVKTPRAVIRKSFEVDYIGEGDCEILLDALQKRNILSHVYLFDIAQQAEALIKGRYHPVLRRLHRTLRARRTR